MKSVELAGKYNNCRNIYVPVLIVNSIKFNFYYKIDERMLQYIPKSIILSIIKKQTKF